MRRSAYITRLPSTSMANPSRRLRRQRPTLAYSQWSAALNATAAPSTAQIGKHCKLMPTVGERLIWGFGDGSTMPVFETPLGRIGAAICWENYMPMLRMHMFSQGISIYCAPTVDDRDTGCRRCNTHRPRRAMLRADRMPIREAKHVSR